MPTGDVRFPALIHERNAELERPTDVSVWVRRDTPQTGHSTGCRAS